MTLPTTKEDANYYATSLKNTVQMQSPSYRLAYDDFDFMMRDELRPLRLQLELLKPEITMSEHGITSTVVIFGSARTLDSTAAQANFNVAKENLAKNPDDKINKQAVLNAKQDVKKSNYYEQARKLGALITVDNLSREKPLVVVTGGGGGIMEAANRGATEAGGKSIGFNIVLPKEQTPNSYITPELCFQFHYFSIRKMHFLMRAKALVAFPGGFGTLDEVFDALTLIQTKKIPHVPVILFGKSYWDRIINFNVLVDEGTISAEDLDLIQYAETAEEAWTLIKKDFLENINS
ncbi:lysine decarboxylase [Methylococcaceae bacterium]|nr:lysine decarboxylase [Methylococcaceae bacterium]